MELLFKKVAGEGAIASNHSVDKSEIYSLGTFWVVVDKQGPSNSKLHCEFGGLVFVATNKQEHQNKKATSQLSATMHKLQA